jgi:hypothetical protein
MSDVSFLRLYNVNDLLVKLLLGLASVDNLWFNSNRIRGHILLSQSRLPKPRWAGSITYIHRNSVAQLQPWVICSLYVASYESQSYGGNSIHFNMASFYSK